MNSQKCSTLRASQYQGIQPARYSLSSQPLTSRLIPSPSLEWETSRPNVSQRQSNCFLIIRNWATLRAKTLTKTASTKYRSRVNSGNQKNRPGSLSSFKKTRRFPTSRRIMMQLICWWTARIMGWKLSRRQISRKMKWMKFIGHCVICGTVGRCLRRSFWCRLLWCLLNTTSSFPLMNCKKFNCWTKIAK